VRREYGEYEVTGRREYRGHAPGSVFAAQIDRAAEQRAIQRGDIRLIRRVTPAVPPGAVLPDGWLTSSLVPTEAPEGASLIEGGGG
jgi:hypothetical protein